MIINMANLIKLGKSPQALSAMAEQFKALGDETRLGLIMAVASSENSEACVCDLTPRDTERGNVASGDEERDGAHRHILAG